MFNAIRKRLLSSKIQKTHRFHNLFEEHGSVLINSTENGVSYTARTTAFATATGITDATILGALNVFDLDITANGIDVKLKALYPFVGGTSSTCKYNFMNPLDTNAAFRLDFFGGWTFSSTGALPNGVNGFADTFLDPFAELTANDNHISVYCRTNDALNNVPIGASDNSGQLNLLQMNIIANSALYYYSGELVTELTSALADAKGFFTGTTRAINDRKTFKNSTQQQSLTSSIATIYPNFNVTLGPRNSDNSPSQYSSIELALASIGDGLTDTDVTNYYNAVQTLQTSLSRQV